MHNRRTLENGNQHAFKGFSDIHDTSAPSVGFSVKDRSTFVGRNTGITMTTRSDLSLHAALIALSADGGIQSELSAQYNLKGTQPSKSVITQPGAFAQD